MLNFLILFRQNQIKQSYSSSLTYQQSYAKCTSTQRFIAFKTYVIYIHIHTGVYSSTNWPPFTGGQNSILNWVLKLNPSNQKIKSNKNCLDCLERALFILFFFTFRSYQQSKKSVPNYTPENKTCARQTSFSAIFPYGADFPNNPHSKQDPQPLRQRRSWTKSFYFLTLMSKRKSPGNEVAQGLNWRKESWDNAHVRINQR